MARGFIVYPTYKIEDNKAYIYLFGRLENGESFLTISPFRPYFFIKTEDRKKAEKLAGLEYEDSDFKDFDGNKATKVVLDTPKAVPEVRNMFTDAGINCYEADIRFAQRFLIDKDIKGCVDIDGGYEKGKLVDRVYKEPKLKPTKYFPKLKVLSIDIETDLKADKLFSISLVSEDYRKVLITKKGKFRNAECFDDEKSLLERFREIILSQDPDVIVGWNVIDFDFKVLKGMFDKYKIPFQFGRVDWNCTLRLTDSFFMDSKADFPGRAVLDGIHLLKVSFIGLEDYKLSTAAKKFLGEEKVFTSANRWDEIANAYKNDPQKLIDYNLKDSQLVLDIIKKSGVLDLSIKRSILTRMQLDRVKSSIASLDSLYLKELQKRKIVANSVFSSEAEERIKGGYVMKSKPGIYDNILVFDFKSLYPSIIRTFNIDPLTFVDKKKAAKLDKSKLIEAPNGAYFSHEDGILPTLIQQLWAQRDRAKKEKDKLESNAIKILMNSFFGVLANPMCRFYSLDMANAITHFGQFLIKLMAQKIEEQGYEVIYGDTDSIFVDAKEKDYKKCLKIAEEIQYLINNFHKAYIKKNYRRESFMDLEFEKCYKRFLMPRVRHGEEGAKKRYAGLVEEGGKDKMEFVGLEVVRRDWTGLAKKFQVELLERIFRREEVSGYVKEFVEDLKNGKYDSLLIYKKAIRKQVKAYTKTTPPHIQAARKLGMEGVGIIEYMQTVKGPEPLDARKSKIDYQHYIEKQIKPIADSVLGFFDETFDELIAGHKQAKLGEF